MKALKWILGIGCVFLAVVVVLILALTPTVETRQASVEPLRREALESLGIMTLDGEEFASTSQVSQGPPRSDSAELEAAASAPKSETRSKDLSRLAGRPKDSDIIGQYSGLWDRGFTRAYLGGLKRVESASWLSSGDSSRGFALEIGYESYRMGDFETAKKYLREALRIEQEQFRREHICSMLAWLEEDPEIAAALLRESCVSGNRHRLSQAMTLTVVTGSDGLADHYFKRWANAIPQDELANWYKLGSIWPEMQAFKERQNRRAD